MATQQKKAGALPTPPPSTTPEAFQKEYQKNSTATIDPETDTPQPVGPVEVTGWPDAATCALFGAVFSGVYKGEDDKDSDAVQNFQKFLIDQLRCEAQLAQQGQRPQDRDAVAGQVIDEAEHLLAFAGQVDALRRSLPAGPLQQGRAQRLQAGRGLGR